MSDSRCLTSSIEDQGFKLDESTVSRMSSSSRGAAFKMLVDKSPNPSESGMDPIEADRWLESEYRK
jgi:hypothetical protein